VYSTHEEAIASTSADCRSAFGYRLRPSWSTNIVLEDTTVDATTTRIPQHKHISDNVNNTYSALRYTRGKLGELLYAEFADVSDPLAWRHGRLFGFQMKCVLEDDTFLLPEVFERTSAAGLKPAYVQSNTIPLGCSFSDSCINHEFGHHTKRFAPNRLNFYELYNMSSDPFMLKNIYHTAPASLVDELHRRLQVRCQVYVDVTDSCARALSLCLSFFLSLSLARTLFFDMVWASMHTVRAAFHTVPWFILRNSHSVVDFVMHSIGLFPMLLLDNTQAAIACKGAAECTAALQG
jgi:hypothetical protein